MSYRAITPIPVVDAHVHVFPQKLEDALRGWFDRFAWSFHDTGSMEELIERQFDRGLAGMLFLGYAHRPGMAEELNAFLGSMVRRFPHTAALAAVHPEDENPGEIVRRAHERHGLCGVKIHCHVQQVAPEDPALFPVYEAVLAFDGVLNVHAGREPAIDAYGMDVRTITGADRVDRVLERYPRLKLIVPHLGFDESDRFYGMLDRYPGLYLDTTMMLGGFFDAPVDRAALERHADRILYGSDYPHIPYAMETEVQALLDMGLSDRASRRILHENAVNLLPIRPRT